MRPENPLFYQKHQNLPTIDHGEGVWLVDRGGKRYLDGSSGAVAANIGHGNKRVVEAMTRQAQKVSFAYRTQFENEPALELARRLIGHLSQGLNRVFYTSGGSEAVESALKLARQYHVANGQPGRSRIISRFPSYHGSTLGALSATGYLPLTEPFEPMLASHLYAPAPTCYRCPLEETFPSCQVACARQLEELIQQAGPETIAAFILEPVGGASTGATVAPDPYLGIVSQICRKYSILTIYDEVMTGIGRTGAFCAYQHWDEAELRAEVDILVLSKGFGAGYTPLGAIVSREDIIEVVLAGDGQFAHGHTYAGNPLSCAVGLEVLKVIEDEDLVANAGLRGEQLFEGLRKIERESRIIGDVRGKGLLLGVEFVRDKASREPFPEELDLFRKITAAAFDEGLIVYPRRSFGGLRGDHILIAPPLIITAQEVNDLLARFKRAVTRVEGHILGVRA